MKRVAIVGGGITGLSAALHLQQHGRGAFEYRLIEAGDRWGGKIVSAQQNGFLIEGGPESFTTHNPTMLELCRTLEIDHRLLSTNGAAGNLFVWSNAKLHKIPEGMTSLAPRFRRLLESELISWAGKLRMGLEYWIPPQRSQNDDESLASFVRRRLGDEALNKVAAPLIANIYAADPERLSLQSTFPRFLKMEKEHGGLLRAATFNRRQNGRSAAMGATFMTPLGGLQEIVNAIVARLNPSWLLLNHSVRAITERDGIYVINFADGTNLHADVLILATPASVSARLLEKVDAQLAAQLRRIRYVSTATVSAGFQREAVRHALNGFGFVVPREQGLGMLACSWCSQKFSYRAPDDCVLLRVFLGGALDEHLAEQDERRLLQVALRELRETLRITAPPVFAKVFCWPKANPQYDVGHQQLVGGIRRLAALHSGLHLAGAAYQGAGIPDCAQSGIEAAKKIMQEKSTTTSPSKGANMTTAKPAVSARRAAHDYAQNPMLVYWEMTQACALACRHCRAEAMPCAHPRQLSHEESRDLLRQISEFGEPLPHLILTGGDPLQRTDVYELIDYASELGLKVSITPSATPALTPEVMQKLKSHGIQSLALSIDGSTAARHEAIRGVPGCFAWTMQAARAAAELGFPLQINSLVSQETADDLPALYELVKSLNVMRWSLFFLIAVGRGKALEELSPQQGEELMHWIYELAQKAPFAIKTTEAPYYRRIALNRMREHGMRPEQIQRTSVYQGFGIRDGHGIVFVSNQGDIAPAGFLPLAVANVRNEKLVDVYRNSPVFQALHTPTLFHGKCGYCEYNAICGGSRARAYAHTGDPLGSDPFCGYDSRATV